MDELSALLQEPAQDTQTDELSALLAEPAAPALHERINAFQPQAVDLSQDSIKADDRGWLKTGIDSIFGPSKKADPVGSVLALAPEKRKDALAAMPADQQATVGAWMTEQERIRQKHRAPDAKTVVEYSDAMLNGSEDDIPSWLRALKDAETPEAKAGILLALKQSKAQATADIAGAKKDAAEEQRKQGEDYAAALEVAKRLPKNAGLRMLEAAVTQIAGDAASLVARPLDLADSGISDEIQNRTGLVTSANEILNKEAFVNPRLANVGAGAIASMVEMIPGVGLGNLAKAKGLSQLANVAPAAFGGMVQGNQSISEGRKAGLSGTDLAGYTIANTASEALFEYIPLLKGVGVEAMAMRKAASKGIADVLKQAAKDQGAEQLGELATSLTQAVINRVSGVDPSALTPGSLYDLVVNTAIATGIMGGLSGPGIAQELGHAAKAGLQPTLEQHLAGMGLPPEAIQMAVQTSLAQPDRPIGEIVAAIQEISQSHFPQADMLGPIAQPVPATPVAAPAAAVEEPPPVEPAPPAPEPVAEAEQAKAATEGAIQPPTPEEIDKVSGIPGSNWIRTVVENHEKLSPDAEVLHFDLDNFKAINDTFDHETGDQIIRATGQLMAKYFPDMAYGRAGGEEFVVVGPKDALRDAAQKFHAAFPDAVQVNGEPVTISGGISRGFKNNAKGEPRLVADEYGYRSKSAGRNALTFDNPDQPGYTHLGGHREKGYVREFLHKQTRANLEELSREVHPPEVRDAARRALQAFNARENGGGDAPRKAGPDRGTGPAPAGSQEVAPQPTPTAPAPATPQAATTAPAPAAQESAPAPTAPAVDPITDIKGEHYNTLVSVPTGKAKAGPLTKSLNRRLENLKALAKCLETA